MKGEEFSLCGVLQWGILLGLVCSASLASAEAGMVYTIDPTRSEFVVQLFKAGVGAALAHDHVVRATEYAGRVQVNPATPTTGSIVVEVQAASLKADEPNVRQKYGLPPQLSERERQEIQASMTAKGQLDVEHYPVMKFTSTRIEPQTAEVYTVTGELTIRGVTQTVTFPAQVQQRENTLHAQGSFRFTQSSFGYEPYSAFLGAVKNQDEVLLHFDIVAAP